MSTITALPTSTLVVAVAAAAALLLFVLKWVLDTPSRTYDRESNTVAREYDAWTDDGILEYYWGEHIHLGYYAETERSGPFYGKKDFIEAKYDFIREMYKWGGADKPKKILDVGCGIGGTSRFLAKMLPDSEIVGITLSPAQQARATALAKEQGVPNARFQVMDALAMEFDADSFDMVWGCESGEHMPDKQKYIEEMARVCKPGGNLVVATWCQREEPPAFSAQEKKNLQFLYDEWTHPYFISIEEYERIMKGTGKLESVASDDWAKETIPSWRHSVWVGVWDPWPVIRRPHIWLKTMRDIVTLERMHRAFSGGLMRYGMIKSVKKAATPP